MGSPVGRNQVWWCVWQTTVDGVDEATIQKLPILPRLNVLTIAGGHDHIVIVTTEGEVYTVGPDDTMLGCQGATPLHEPDSLLHIYKLNLVEQGIRIVAAAASLFQTLLVSGTHSTSLLIILRKQRLMVLNLLVM